jgi:hypothetical protein
MFYQHSFESDSIRSRDRWQIDDKSEGSCAISFNEGARSIQISWLVINRISLTCPSIDSSLNVLSKVFSLEFDQSQRSVPKWPLEPSSLANSRHVGEFRAK